MTTYHEFFLPIFGLGCLIAVIASFIAAQKSGIIVPGLFLAVGIVAFWASLFLGSGFGYQAWQSVPDPPAEAFNDTAPLGATYLGLDSRGILLRVHIWIFTAREIYAPPRQAAKLQSS